MNFAMANIQPLDIRSHGRLVTPFSTRTEAQISRPDLVHGRPLSFNTEQTPGDLENLRSNRSSAWRLKYSRRLHSAKRYTMFANKRSKITDDRDSNLVKERLEAHPEGFPRIAAYVNSDVDTALFRRFGIVHCRLLLYMQVELTDLEAKLAKLDEDDNSKDETEWRIGHSIHHDDGNKNEDRKKLVEELRKKLIDYDDLLLRDSQLRKLPRPSERVHRNFMDYIYTSNPFGEPDQRFIYHEHDFVSLQQYEESWLDELLHRFMGHCKKGVLRFIFVSPTDQAKTDDQYLHYYSADRLGVLIKIIIAIACTALLLIPIYIFIANNLSPEIMTSITLIFAFAFATAISLFTNARRQEVFACTAAYCAVLVVFIGNLQQ